jgi:hypothetical protein
VVAFDQIRNMSDNQPVAALADTDITAYAEFIDVKGIGGASTKTAT